jgi:hypothetical protein
VLGYLGAGAVLGPLSFGPFMEQAPWLCCSTVVDPENVTGIDAALTDAEDLMNSRAYSSLRREPTTLQWITYSAAAFGL